MKHSIFAALRAPRKDRGAAAVELALLLPVLLMIVFGIVDFGRMLNAQIAVTEAAREAAHAYAMGGNYQQRVDTVTTNLKTSGAVTVSPVTTCPAAPGPNDDATVTVTYQFSYVTPVGALMSLFGSAPAGTKTLSSTGVMPCLS